LCLEICCPKNLDFSYPPDNWVFVSSRPSSALVREAGTVARKYGRNFGRTLQSAALSNKYLCFFQAGYETLSTSISWNKLRFHQRGTNKPRKILKSPFLNFPDQVPVSPEKRAGNSHDSALDDQNFQTATVRIFPSNPAVICRILPVYGVQRRESGG